VGDRAEVTGYEFHPEGVRGGAEGFATGATASRRATVAAALVIATAVSLVLERTDRGAKKARDEASVANAVSNFMTDLSAPIASIATSTSRRASCRPSSCSIAARETSTLASTRRAANDVPQSAPRTRRARARGIG